MNGSTLFMAGLSLPGIVMAQPSVMENDVATMNWPALAADGGRLFFSLLGGVLLALAFQWVLTSLAMATGIAAHGASSRKSGNRSFYREDEYRRGEYRDESRLHERHADGMFRDLGPDWDEPAAKVESAAGIRALITTVFSAFFASWLSAEMIRYGGRTEAVVLSLMVWAGFMFTMMWLEASLIGSMTSGLLGAAKGGLKTAIAPVRSAAGALSGIAGPSAEEIAAKVREEFNARAGSGGIKEKLRDYISRMPSPSFDRAQIERDANHLFEDQEIHDAAKAGGNSIDRRRFQEIIASRGDLPPDDQRMLTDTLYDNWNRAVQEGRNNDIISPSESYAGGQIRADGSRAAEGRATEGRALETSQGAEPALHGETPARASGSAGPYVPAASGLSSPGMRTAGSTGLSPSGFPARFQAFKDFLRNSDKRDLNPVRLEQEVETLLLHPEEGRSTLEKSFRDMHREEILQALRNRRDITLQETDAIADIIEASRIRLLSRSEIREHRAQEIADRALARIRDWTYSLKRPELDYDGIRGDISLMLEEPGGGLENLRSRISGVDRATLINAFSGKQGLSKMETEKLAEQAEKAMKTAEERAGKIEEETRRRMDAIRRTALENADASRRAAAAASWWLFVIAVATAVASALGGLAGANR